MLSAGAPPWLKAGRARVRPSAALSLSPRLIDRILRLDGGPIDFDAARKSGELLMEGAWPALAELAAAIDPAALAPLIAEAMAEGD
ncbi:MAG: hypothetical protein U1E65_11735 [Myxococcota bacterium]